MTGEVEGIRHRGCPKKTWWDYIKDDTESLGLSQKDAQSRNKMEEYLRGQPANPGSSGKMDVQTESVCVVVVLFIEFNSGTIQIK